jgi:putative ABC transport system permease protein
VISLVLRELLRMLAWGRGTGLAAAFLLTRLLAHLLYRVQPTDLTATLSAALVLAAVALAAASIPCHRAANLTPSAALRQD